MHLNKKLIDEFKDDVRHLLASRARGVLHSSSGCYVNVYFNCGSTVDINLYTENGYSRKESEVLAKKIYDRVLRDINPLVEKWKGIFDFDVKSSSPSIGGEGEYDVDYGPEVTLCFEIGSKVFSVSEKVLYSYLKARYDLGLLLDKFNCKGYVAIRDDNNDITCSIGDYFKYRYSDGKVVPVSFIKPNEEQLGEISLAVGKMFSTLAEFGVEFESVLVDGWIPRIPCRGYLLELENGEFNLWIDVYRDFT